MNKGKLITLEGGEGVGKTTNLAFIRQFLEQRGKRVVVTREPGGTELGEKIREILLGHHAIAAQTELLLMFAARAQHLDQVIFPALADGFWVLSDRFTDASYAYQGGGRGLGRELIEVLERYVHQGLTPDLTLLLDAPVEVGLLRARKRGAVDRFEAETQAFFERVRGAYREQAARFPQRIRMVDATRSLSEVQAIIAHQLEELCRS